MNSFAILPRNGLQPQPDSQESRGFAADVQAGLRRRRKAIPSKYFYDTRGSALFEQICELPDYYPTHTECTLLDGHARSEEHTSELQSLMRISYAVFCLQKTNNDHNYKQHPHTPQH